MDVAKYQAIGTPNTTMIPKPSGLLCSDGLTKELTDYGIRHFLDENPDPAAAVSAMLEAALENGGRDNITIVVLDVGRTAEGDDSSTAED